MSKDDLPTYAIVELLIRLSEEYPLIGNYKDHAFHEYGIIVKTTNGHINLPVSLVLQQFNKPGLITKAELNTVANYFKIY